MQNTVKNHVYMIFDSSGSMHHIIDKAVEVFNNQIKFLRDTSLSFAQETRISFYEFNSNTKCMISDVDVARPMELERIQANGQTALIDAVTTAIGDAKEQPQKYGDHSFLFYIITDGGENASSNTNVRNFPNLINGLPDNYTIVALVPDTNGKIAMERYGVPKGNIDKWEATSKGVEELGKKMEATISNYYNSRARGIRASKTVFTDLTQMTTSQAKQSLDKLNPRSFKIIKNGKEKKYIKEFVEENIGKYINGNSYYKLVKNEHIQPKKEIIIRNKNNGECYSGQNARKLLNLPNQEVKFVPGDFGDWEVFVQSTSVNRNIIPEQEVLVIK